MNKSFKLWKLAGLEISARPSVLVAVLGLWAVLSVAGMTLFKLKPRRAATAGLLATLLHWVTATWHQLGHARAAHLTGFPMRGIDYWGPLSTSMYPKQEGIVPADIHIQRALGGPIFSLLLSLVAGLLVFALRPLGGAAWFVALTFFADNFFTFTVGALLPIDFADGGTLRHWWGQRHGRVVINEQ